MMKRIALFATFFLLTSWLAEAKVSHVSINLRAFELGESPIMQVNLITNKKDLSLLTFVLSQQGQEEKLMVVSLNKFMLLLTGVDDVFDAELVVSEYRVDRWQEVQRLPIFAEGVDMAPIKAKLRTIQAKIAEIAKTPKSQQIYHQKLQQQVMVKSGSTAKMKPKVLPATQAGEIKKGSASSDSNEIVKQAIGSTEKLTGPLTKADCYLEYTSAETLWRIASRYGKQWKVNPYSAVMSIYDANVKAFNKGKISSLRADVKLVCPSEKVIEANKSSKQAKLRFDML